MTLTEMRQRLESRDIQLTKSLGQNFLHDGNQLRRIVAAGAVESTDRVLEIGPGLGPLTALLLEKAAGVLAIEKDARLVAVLRERFPAFAVAAGAAAAEGTAGELLHADALEWLQENPRDWSGWKLVANLPYSVGSPILVELAEAPVPPDRLVATLQTEVVRRIAARPDTDDYGLLTLLLGLRYTVKESFGIPRGCFHPAPDVDSACVTLVRRKEPLLDAEGGRVFTQLVKLAFSQRRKMMMKLLKTRWPVPLLEEAFAACGIPAGERAEKLPVETFVALTRRLRDAPAASGGPPG
jgi:16S rRNA (adenine1518-N6/adenine1519-N6)-dimethyltransferase